MKLISAFIVSFATTGCLAAPSKHVARSFFGDIRDGLQKLGHNLENATFAGITNTIAQSIENPGLTFDRVKVVTSLSQSKTAFANIANQANVQNNQQVLSFAAKGTEGLTGVADGINRIGQALISNTTPSLEDQKDIAVGIKSALDAVSCMDAWGDSDLQNTISAASDPLNSLKAGGEDVIASQNHSFVDLGLPDNFDTLPANCN